MTHETETNRLSALFSTEAPEWIVDNEDRADRIADALREYFHDLAGWFGRDDENFNDVATGALTDALADMQHLAKRYSLDWNEIVERADATFADDNVEFEPVRALAR